MTLPTASSGPPQRHPNEHRAVLRSLLPFLKPSHGGSFCLSCLVAAKLPTSDCDGDEAAGRRMNIEKSLLVLPVACAACLRHGANFSHDSPSFGKSFFARVMPAVRGR